MLMDLVSLHLTYSCLFVKQIQDIFSSWEEVIVGVTKGSVVGPILSNIVLIDLFLVIEETEFASYSDDNTFCMI